MPELMTHTAGFAYGIGPGPHDEADKSYIEAKIWAADDLADFTRQPRHVAIGLSARNDASAIPSRWTSRAPSSSACRARPCRSSCDANIFKPLGMVDTDFFVPAGEAAAPVATLYHKYGVPTLSSELPPSSFLRDPSVDRQGP